jgi:arylsulfatase A
VHKLSLSAEYGIQASNARPNILVILCDDLGYGDLACFGHPHIRTPNLDRLAEGGIRFTDCYSAAPVCSPSRVGLLTGRNPNRTGIYDWIPLGHPMHMAAEERTIANVLRNAGYDTGLFGKWHCNGVFNKPDQPQPDQHGFDHWYATQNNAAPSHENPTNFVRNGREVGPQVGFSCRLVAQEASHWISNRADRSKPFFGFVCFHEPHEPVASPVDLVEQYARVARSKDEAQYFANVENMDAAVGDLMEALEEQGFAENTLVFFTSDNGPETLSRYKTAYRSYGTPGSLRGMKLWVYEGGIRVPGIAYWPKGIAPGQTVREPVCSLDLLPTFATLSGEDISTGKALDGTDLTGLLTNGAMLERSAPLYWFYYRAYPHPKAALRDGDWIVLGRWDGPDLGPGGSVQKGDVDLIKKHNLIGFELYNLKDDPSQSRDLASSEPERLQILAKQLIEKYTEIRSEGKRWSD